MRFSHIKSKHRFGSDGICFDVRIAWQSYLFSLLLTFVFAVLVRIAMSYKLSRISMSESLKAVE